MKVYKIYEISYRYGDEQTPDETIFTTPEVRDEYFKELLKISKENDRLTERLDSTTENEFVFDDGGKWSYETKKSDEDMKIIESFTINEKGLFRFSYMK